MGEGERESPRYSEQNGRRHYSDELLDRYFDFFENLTTLGELPPILLETQPDGRGRGFVPVTRAAQPSAG